MSKHFFEIESIRELFKRKVPSTVEESKAIMDAVFAAKSAKIGLPSDKTMSEKAFAAARKNKGL